MGAVYPAGGRGGEDGADKPMSAPRNKCRPCRRGAPAEWKAPPGRGDGAELKLVWKQNHHPLKDSQLETMKSLNSWVSFRVGSLVSTVAPSPGLEQYSLLVTKLFL